MLTIHHLHLSQSERIVWLCEELAVPYRLVSYDRDARRGAPPDYKRLHPAGTAPVITDGDLVLPESGAIIAYIARRHGDGHLIVPPEHPHFADYLFWYHYANASMMPGIIMDIVGKRLGGDGYAADRGPRAVALAEAHLGGAPWFAGDAFTAADIMMMFPLSTMRLFSGQDLAECPNIRAWLARIGARPAYRAAMARAEPGFTPLLI